LGLDSPGLAAGGVLSNIWQAENARKNHACSEFGMWGVEEIIDDVSRFAAPGRLIPHRPDCFFSRTIAR